MPNQNLVRFPLEPKHFSLTILHIFLRRALWTSCFGLILIYLINFYTGMILVAHYKDCDPVKAKEIGASDEILPLYVLDELGHFKGITGFFVAGIFAASLG